MGRPDVNDLKPVVIVEDDDDGDDGQMDGMVV